MALETGGGIFRALPLARARIRSWWSMPTCSPTSTSARSRSSPGRCAHLVLVPNPPITRAATSGSRTASSCRTDADRFTYSGIGLYRPQFFEGCAPGRFPLLPLLNRAIGARLVRGQLYRGGWSDVGSPERLASLEARLAAVE